MSQNATSVDNQAVAIGIQGNCLTDLAPVARVVFDRKVCKRHVIGIDQHRIRTECAEHPVQAAAVPRGHFGAQVAHDAYTIGRLALNRHM